MALIPASLITQGVIKSGSPTPSETTSGLEDAKSKNFLMPDGFSCFAFLLIKSLIFMQI